MAASPDLRLLIEQGAVDALAEALRVDPAMANRTIRWGEQGKNETDPLHYVSDCVFNSQIDESTAAAMARSLLTSGASVEGTAGRETPLIGAASLGVPAVAGVLIEAGANVEPTALFGATALHWAAYMGLPDTVRLLLERGAEVEARCTEFDATPLFWAVQGYSRYGTPDKRDQVGAARELLTAGADVTARNSEGALPAERAAASDDGAMSELLRDWSSQA